MNRGIIRGHGGGGEGGDENANGRKARLSGQVGQVET
jgi:hypothetical protein